MKKLWLMIPLLSLFCFAGCGESMDIRACMSEQTELYFYGEGEGINANIAVGKREKNYVLDGQPGENCDFSLITLSLQQQNYEEEIGVCVDVNGTKSEVTLQLNPLNMTYMADLGYAICGNAAISISVANQEIVLENISKNFKVDYQKGIEIGYAAIEDKSLYMNENTLACEGYIKIVDGRKFGGEGLYWCFTILGQNQDSENVLISTEDENTFFRG